MCTYLYIGLPRSRAESAESDSVEAAVCRVGSITYTWRGCGRGVHRPPFVLRRPFTCRWTKREGHGLSSFNKDTLDSKMAQKIEDVMHELESASPPRSKRPKPGAADGPPTPLEKGDPDDPVVLSPPGKTQRLLDAAKE